MKKVFISTLLAFLLTIGICIPVFGDSYVPSIGVRTNVKIKGGQLNPKTGCYEIWDWCEDCHRKIVVTPYYLKHTIESNKSRDDIDIAYEQIIASSHVYDLTIDVVPVAHQLGVHEDDLVVRDLFDITDYYCELQGKEVRIDVDTETLEHYVCLLHYVDEHWEVVPDAYVSSDGYSYLAIRVDHLSPFAIIVATDYRYSPDQGGLQHGCIWHWFELLDLIITLIIVQFDRLKDFDPNKDDWSDWKKDNKKSKQRRDILSLINLILCIIFVILGSCFWDIVVLIVDIVLLIIIYRYSHKKRDVDEQEKQ